MDHTVRRRIAGIVAALSMGLGLAVLDGAAPSRTSVQAACSIATTLRIGSRGDAVRCLQSALTAAGFNSGPVDGAFGSVTYRATVAFQRARGPDRRRRRRTTDRRCAGDLGERRRRAGAGGGGRPGAGWRARRILRRLRDAAHGIAGRCRALRAEHPERAGVQLGSRRRGVRLGHQGCRRRLPAGAGPVRRRGGRSPRRAAPSGSGALLRPVRRWRHGCPGARLLAAGRCAGVGPPGGRRHLVGLVGRRRLLVNSGGWQCARMDMPGRVGRNGVRALADRRSGDGTTPGGVFGLGTMTAPDGQTFQFFGNGANPGVNGGWRQVRGGDCWGATPGTADYNLLVSRPAVGVHRRRRVPPQHHRRLLGRCLDRRQHGPQPLRRRSR